MWMIVSQDISIHLHVITNVFHKFPYELCLTKAINNPRRVYPTSVPTHNDQKLSNSLQKRVTKKKIPNILNIQTSMNLVGCFCTKEKL